MNIVMLGAGNVATHLSKALQLKGHNITQVYSKTVASAKALAAQLNAPYTTEINDVKPTADIYIYALKDNALEDVIHKLDVPNAIHIHTAGSVSIDVFEDRVRYFGVIYPMQTFSKSKEVNFENIALMVKLILKKRLIRCSVLLSNYQIDATKQTQNNVKKFIFRLYLPVILQITCTRLPKSY